MAQTEKTIIIPETDQERFIDFSAFPDGAEWFGRGVKLAGISRLSPAYLVRYPNAKRFLVMVCSRGRFEVECDHFKAVIGAGDFVLMIPGTIQYLHALEPAEMAFLLVNDDGRWPRRPLHSHISARRFLSLMEMAWSESRQYGGNAGEQRAFGDAEVCRMLSGVILALASREILAPLPGGEEGSRLRMLTGLWREIDRHPERAWTIEEMARYCSVSAPHLFALTRKFFHTSPGAMLLRIRMHHAESLLRNTELAVSEVAENCGYSEAYSFTRAFRRHCGMLPGEFRRRRHVELPESGRA